MVQGVHTRVVYRPAYTRVVYRPAYTRVVHQWYIPGWCISGTYPGVTGVYLPGCVTGVYLPGCRREGGIYPGVGEKEAYTRVNRGFNGVLASFLSFLREI